MIGKTVRIKSFGREINVTIYDKWSNNENLHYIGRVVSIKDAPNYSYLIQFEANHIIKIF